jgi:hypothetical protein
MRWKADEIFRLLVKSTSNPIFEVIGELHICTHTFTLSPPWESLACFILYGSFIGSAIRMRAPVE